MTGDWQTTAHARIQVRFASAETGYEVRVRRREEETDGRKRCEECGRAYHPNKNSSLHAHACRSPWITIHRFFGTRQLAYAAGARKLDLVDAFGAVIGAAA